MKKDYRPEEMRETAEAIRTAVMPKSITPDMVGGTMLGILDALGEVVEVLGEIPREHVKIRVRGFDGEAAVDPSGAIVRLDMFSVGGYPTVAIPRRELIADANGLVEFDVPLGYKYAVSSHIEGLGASFQWVFEAVSDFREINLWNMPIGVWALGYTDLADYSIDRYMEFPWVTQEYMEEVPDNVASWAQDEEEFPDNEGYSYIGILVSTAETTFAIGENNLSEEAMMWCDDEGRNTVFPLMKYDLWKRGEVYDWEQAQERARNDMDGSMNTAKILAFCPTHIAARWVLNSPSQRYDERRFLPSAGQLYLMYLNRDAINKIAEQFNDEGYEFKLMPYQNDKGQWQNPNGFYESWWSSSVFDPLCSWYVNNNGYIYTNYRNYRNYVRAVSAFHFDY